MRINRSCQVPGHVTQPCTDGRCVPVGTYLLVKVSQPVHALELVGLEFAVEDGGLRNFLAGLDGGIRETVALPEPGAAPAGDVQRGAATVLRLLVELPRLHTQ